jgi:hypothetical protein
MSYPRCSAVPSGPHITARFPGGWNGAGGMVYNFNHALHRQAARWYIRRYHMQNGDWPRGEHTFEVTHGKGEGFDVQTPIGTSSGTRAVTMTFEVYLIGDADEATRSNLNGLLYAIPI